MKNFYFRNYSFFLLIILNIKISAEAGVYNIISVQKYSSIFYNGKDIKLKKENLGSQNINFRLKFQKLKDGSNSDYLYIQHLKTDLYLGFEMNKNDNKINLIISNNTEIKETENTSYLFDFKELEKDIYTIKSKLGCYLYESNSNLFCSFDPLTKNHNFFLLKIFSEVDKENKHDLELLEKEPIDVLIKYIDLTDPSLKRENIKQINKDEQHDELRYSIRSVLQNIPWIRKIFILMPNERVRFLKSPELINDKIVFVKDKDLLGYDSSNIHAFQFRLWKLKQFGISDNFIVMDDDYFIGKPLNKSDFFYVQNNTVVPAIIATDYQVHTEKTFKNEYNYIKKNLEKFRSQSSSVFMYTVYNTYLFYINIFKSPIIVPYFTHNAIPINANDLKEVYDLIYESKYRNATLEALYRHPETLQFQTAVMVYTFNKYFRKVNFVKYSYIDVAGAINGNYDSDLFCINTGGNKDYSKLSHLKAKIAMNKLFPIPTEYEVINYTDIPYTSFQLIKNLESEKNKIDQIENSNIISKLQKETKEKIEFINNFKELSNQMKKENKKSLKEISLLNKNYTKCINKRNFLEEQINDLLMYESNNNSNINNDIENLKEELEKKIEIRKNNIIKMNMYINGINENIKKLEELEDKDYKLYLIASLEFIILISLLIIFFFFCISQKFNKRKDNKKGKALPIL